MSSLNIGNAGLETPSHSSASNQNPYVTALHLRRHIENRRSEGLFSGKLTITADNNKTKPQTSVYTP